MLEEREKCYIPDEIEPGEWQGLLIPTEQEVRGKSRFMDKLLSFLRRTLFTK